MRRCLATRMISPATSRTWATEPAALDRSPSAASAPSRSRTPRAAPARASPARCAGRSRRSPGSRSASPPPSRCARSRIWAADSSADTYSVRRPAAHRLASAIVVSVDLPIPGAPPIRTSEPGHDPAAEHVVKLADPGAQPVVLVGADVAERDRRHRAPRRPRRGRAAPAPAAGTVCSTSVFHSPQPGQRPAQRAVSWPQAEQTWIVDGAGIGASLRPALRPPAVHGSRRRAATRRRPTGSRRRLAVGRLGASASPSSAPSSSSPEPPSAPTPTGVGFGAGSMTDSLTSPSSGPRLAGSTSTVEPGGTCERRTKSASGSSM